jgi:hypothetical protein
MKKHIAVQLKVFINEHTPERKQRQHKAVLLLNLDMLSTEDAIKYISGKDCLLNLMVDDMYTAMQLRNTPTKEKVQVGCLPRWFSKNKVHDGSKHEI